MRVFLVRVALALMAVPGAAHLLAAQDAAPAVTVTGLVARPLTLTAAELAALPRASVTTTSGGIETRWEGVWVHEVLKAAGGVPLGSELRGEALTTYIMAEASDGYRVLYSIGELDPAFHDNQFLLADSADGRPLFGDDGNFRIVSPLDGRGARSVRMLTRLEVGRVEG